RNIDKTIKKLTDDVNQYERQYRCQQQYFDQKMQTNNLYPQQINITVQKEVKQSLLSYCEQGDISKVRALLKQRPNPAQYVNTMDEGKLPLHTACECGHTEIVQLLLDKGADAKQCNEDGCTAMHAAALGGKVDVLQLIAAKNSDLVDMPAH